MKTPQCIRTVLIDVSVRAMSWIAYRYSMQPEFTRLDRAWNWLDARCMDVFNWAFDGSAEEIESALAGEVPPSCMSARQRHAIGPDEDWNAHCVQPGCHWTGPLTDSHFDVCPCCLEPVFIEPAEWGLRHKRPVALLPQFAVSLRGGAA